MGFRRILRRLPGRVRGVIHVGAHVGQESGTYRRLGIRRQVWVEPHPGNFERLIAGLPKDHEVRAFNVACAECDGSADLFCQPAGDGQENTLMHGAVGTARAPAGVVRVPVFGLDSLLLTNGLEPAGYDLLVLDVQGAELRCLRGAGGLLRSLRAVICEVQASERPSDGWPRCREVREFLEGHGYSPTFADWTEPEWGNMLFVRRQALSPLERARLGLWRFFDARTLAPAR
jgi:FkbM family methyltransferase